MSTLIEQINKDFMDAYKAKDMERKNFLGLVKGEVTKETKEPSDKEVVKVLKKMEKSLLTTTSSASESLGDTWTDEDELKIVQAYLPKQMSEDEIDAKLKEVVDGGANHIGQIMGAFKGLEVDMKLVKEKADQILNSK